MTGAGKIDGRTWVSAGVAAAVLVTAVTVSWGLASDRAAALEGIRAAHGWNERQDIELRELKASIREMYSELLNVRQGVARIERELGTLPAK